MGVLTAELLDLTRIYADGKYNAFTDMKFYKGYYWVAFRSGKAHISPEGRIIIIRSKDLKNWESFAEIKHPGLDLRDPRLIQERRLPTATAHDEPLGGRSGGKSIGDQRFGGPRLDP